MHWNITVVLLLCAGMGLTSRAGGQAATKAIKISDFIYMAPGAGNVYLVTTPDGNVIIDTASAGQAANARKILAAESPGAVKYIVLTHGHADHIGGIGLWKEPGTQIIAQRNYVEFVNYVTRLEGFFAPPSAVATPDPFRKIKS